MDDVETEAGGRFWRLHDHCDVLGRSLRPFGKQNRGGQNPVYKSRCRGRGRQQIYLFDRKGGRAVVNYTYLSIGAGSTDICGRDETALDV